MKKIQVLMSTFNGEKYIKGQIDSILNQKNVQVDLLVRDDYSTDNTYTIIKENYKQCTIYKGNNIGYKKSFYDLIRKSGDYEFYAFSDQDDVWDEDKLSIAVKKLMEYDSNIPLLYCSNLRVVDENLNFISKLHPESEKIVIDKKCSLVENLSYGCTTVFNKRAKEIALMYEPEYTSHDGWINLICSFFGKAIYDDIPHISYRQHGKNTLGGKRDFVTVWKKRLKSFKKLNIHIRDISAKEFLNAYNQLLIQEDKDVIKIVAEYRKSFRNKIRLFIRKDIKMCNFDRDFWYRVRIIFSNI